MTVLDDLPSHEIKEHLQPNVWVNADGNVTVPEDLSREGDEESEALPLDDEYIQYQEGELERAVYWERVTRVVGILSRLGYHTQYMQELVLNQDEFVGMSPDATEGEISAAAKAVERRHDADKHVGDAWSS